MKEDVLKSVIQKRIQNGETVSISKVNYSIEIVYNDLSTDKNIRIGIEGHLQSILFRFVKIDQDGYYTFKGENIAYEARISLNESKSIVKLIIDRVDENFSIEFDFNLYDLNEKDNIVENVLLPREMSTSFPERLITDERLNEEITLNEDRIETTIELIEDSDSFTTGVLFERLNHYKWCLNILNSEKKRRWAQNLK